MLITLVWIKFSIVCVCWWNFVWTQQSSVSRYAVLYRDVYRGVFVSRRFCIAIIDASVNRYTPNVPFTQSIAIYMNKVAYGSPIKVEFIEFTVPPPPASVRAVWPLINSASSVMLILCNSVLQHGTRSMWTGCDSPSAVNPLQYSLHACPVEGALHTSSISSQGWLAYVLLIPYTFKH